MFALAHPTATWLPDRSSLENWTKIPAARGGGYCVQTTTGDYPWAFVTLW